MANSTVLRTAAATIAVIALLAFAWPATARDAEDEKPFPVRNLTQVDAVAVSVDPAMFRRENLDEVCSTAIAEALKQRDFKIAGITLGAEGVLKLKGSALIVTEGKPKDIGKTVLNYVATLEASGSEKILFTTVGWARGDTTAEACNIGAEEIASKLSEAKKNTDEDEGMDDEGERSKSD
jgi:hypothetical protein